MPQDIDPGQGPARLRSAKIAAGVHQLGVVRKGPAGDRPHAFDPRVVEQALQ